MGVPGKGGRPRKPTNMRIVDGDKANRFNNAEPVPGEAAGVRPPDWLRQMPRGDWPALGLALKAGRLRAKYTQADLALLLGVTRAQVAAWEKTGDLPVDHLEALRSELGEALVMPLGEPPEAPIDIWYRLAPDLEAKGVLTAWDVDEFAIVCDALVGHRKAAAEVARTGLLVRGLHGGRVKNPAAQLVRDYADIVIKIGARFGLSPSDRAGLKVEKGPAHGGAERLLS